MIAFIQAQCHQATGNLVGAFTILLVGPEYLMDPIKLRGTRIDDRLMQRERISATIEEVPNRHLEEIDPLSFGLPVGQTIVGHAHKKTSSEARGSNIYLSGVRSQGNVIARLSHYTCESIPDCRRKNNPVKSKDCKSRQNGVCSQTERE